jgi:hypothetical protein
MLDPAQCSRATELSMEMTPFHEFLTQLLDQGKIVFRSPTAPRDRPTPPAVATLVDAFATYSLAAAGPPIVLDLEIACAAAELLRQASWALVNHDERTADLERRLKMPGSSSLTDKSPMPTRGPPFRIASTAKRWPASSTRLPPRFTTGR